MFRSVFCGGRRFWRHQKILILFSLAPLALSGCLTTYTNANHEFGGDREDILSRRYVVTRDERFTVVRVHWFPLGIGRPATYGEIELSRGAVVRFAGIQHVWADGIDGDAFNSYRVDGIVMTDPHKGARIDVSRAITERNSDPQLAPARSTSAPFDGRIATLAPLPNDQPSWLDTSAIPPTMRPLSIADLVLAARDPDWASRYYAVQELARREPPDAQAIAALTVAVKDDVGEVRAIAIEALARAGPAAITAVDPLLAHLRDPHTPSGELDAAKRALAAIGKGGYPRVAALLASSNPRDVQNAARVLADAPAGAAREQVPAMETALRHDPRWRESLGYSDILQALANADPAAAMRILIPEIQSTNPQLSYAVGYDLVGIALYQTEVEGASARTNEIVSAFVAALGNPNLSVRSNALSNLASIGFGARSAIPALEKLQSDHPQGQAEQEFQVNLECTLGALANAQPRRIR